MRPGAVRLLSIFDKLVYNGSDIATSWFVPTLASICKPLSQPFLLSMRTEAGWHLPILSLKTQQLHATINS